VPAPGVYRELLNSDSQRYSGSNTINLGPVASEPGACQGQPHSIVLTLPPLGAIFLKREKETQCD
jgi:1,4-alpha-glucan branching enzyme